MTDLIFLVALAAIVAGVVFIYWPAALIIGGLFGVVLAVKLDGDKP